jgi:hypothetical protein
MGSSAYWYFVPYEQDFNSALQKLREREFKLGRYNPVVMFPSFPVTTSTESPGAKHSTIDEAIEDADADGTRSILDLKEVSEVDDYCIARVISKDELLKYFGTDKPDKLQIENQFDMFNDIERGKGFCIVAYKDGKPDELYFVGYSFD